MNLLRALRPTIEVLKILLAKFSYLINSFEDSQRKLFEKNTKTIKQTRRKQKEEGKEINKYHTNLHTFPFTI